MYTGLLCTAINSLYLPEVHWNIARNPCLFTSQQPEFGEGWILHGIKRRCTTSAREAAEIGKGLHTKLLVTAVYNTHVCEVSRIWQVWDLGLSWNMCAADLSVSNIAVQLHSLNSLYLVGQKQSCCYLTPPQWSMQDWKMTSTVCSRPCSAAKWGCLSRLLSNFLNSQSFVSLSWWDQIWLSATYRSEAPRYENWNRLGLCCSVVRMCFTRRVAVPGHDLHDTKSGHNAAQHSCCSIWHVLWLAHHV